MIEKWLKRKLVESLLPQSKLMFIKKMFFRRNVKCSIQFVSSNEKWSNNRYLKWQKNILVFQIVSLTAAHSTQLAKRCEIQMLLVYSAVFSGKFIIVVIAAEEYSVINIYKYYSFKYYSLIKY